MTEGFTTDILKVLVGVILGSLFAFIANFYLKKKDFKDAFYKKIIDKRMTAHEYLESYILFFMDIKVKNEISGLGFNSSKEFTEFYEMTDKLSIHSFWFSSRLDRQVYNCRNNVLSLRNLYVENKIDPYKVKKHFENIDISISSIKQLHFEDFLHLDEVKKFIKNKPYVTYQALNYNRTNELSKVTKK